MAHHHMPGGSYRHPVLDNPAKAQDFRSDAWNRSINIFTALRLAGLNSFP